MIAWCDYTVLGKNVLDSSTEMAHGETNLLCKHWILIYWMNHSHLRQLCSFSIFSLVILKISMLSSTFTCCKSLLNNLPWDQISSWSSFWGSKILKENLYLLIYKERAKEVNNWDEWEGFIFFWVYIMFDPF